MSQDNSLSKMASGYGAPLLSLLSLIVIVQQFPDGGVFTQDGTLVQFWALPAFFTLIATMFLSWSSESENQIPDLILTIFSALARGVWAGLAIGSLMILNAWYISAESGHWPPLFSAISLSSAAIFKADEVIRKLRQGSEVE